MKIQNFLNNCTPVRIGIAAGVALAGLFILRRPANQVANIFAAAILPLCGGIVGGLDQVSQTVKKGEEKIAKDYENGQKKASEDYNKASKDFLAGTGAFRRSVEWITSSHVKKAVICGACCLFTLAISRIDKGMCPTSIDLCSYTIFPLIVGSGATGTYYFVNLVSDIASSL